MCGSVLLSKEKGGFAPHANLGVRTQGEGGQPYLCWAVPRRMGEILPWEESETATWAPRTRPHPLAPKVRKIITSTKKTHNTNNPQNLLSLCVPPRWLQPSGLVWGEGRRGRVRGNSVPPPLFLSLPNPPPPGSAKGRGSAKPRGGAQAHSGLFDVFRRGRVLAHLCPPLRRQSSALIPAGNGSHTGSSSIAAWKRLEDTEMCRGVEGRFVPAGCGRGFAGIMVSQGNPVEPSYSFPSSQTSLPQSPPEGPSQLVS